MTPYFTEKMRKYFFGCRCFVLLTQKSPFTYSHWERSNAHPKSQKIFYPFTYLELRSRNAPCFYKNFEKYFFRLRALILLAQKVPSLIPTESGQLHPLNLKKFFEKAICLKKPPSVLPWKGCLGTAILKKGKKICPPEVAGRDITVKVMPTK